MNPISCPSLTHQCQDNIGQSRLNSAKAVFGTGVKCLVNSEGQRNRDKHTDIYWLYAILMTPCIDLIVTNIYFN